MNPYLLVNGNFVQTNGMDMPNLALATYLAGRNAEVHLVTHYVQHDLARLPNVSVHRVPKPVNSYLMATPLLDWIGRRWASKLSRRNGRVFVNGGNCVWEDVNWVHYVHAAFSPSRSGGALRTLKNRYAHKTFLARERVSLSRARIVIANSDRTRRDVIERLGVAEGRVHTIYYGINANDFRPPTSDERRVARAELGWTPDKSVVAFVGALGDRRKGFDRLFNAWQVLCSRKKWAAGLVVIGAGAELNSWKSRASSSGLADRITFMGFRNDVPRVLAACDALVAPTRYEAYGQGVHEALCCGLPAIVSQSAGVAERYPLELRELLLTDPENVDDLVERLQNWQANAERYRPALLDLSNRLREHTWPDMANQIMQIVESS